MAISHPFFFNYEDHKALKEPIHILNGDALSMRFPNDIQGEILTFRECMIDGPKKGDVLDDIIKQRISFFKNHYEVDKEEYLEKVKSILLRISSIKNATVVLWFEDDLFCQANMWFTMFLLNPIKHNHTIYLARPPKLTPYGFGGLTNSELIQAYKNKIKIQDTALFLNLWKAFKNEDNEMIKKLKLRCSTTYPFTTDALQAYLQSIPSQDSLGLPKETLLAIMSDLQTDDFATIFKEFNERAYIYGYGDLQIKKMLKELY